MQFNVAAKILTGSRQADRNPKRLLWVNFWYHNLEPLFLDNVGPYCYDLFFVLL